jgi:hypothetical protein
MRRSTRPGDLPLPRPLRRGQAATIYRLGRQAGERAREELAEESRPGPVDFGGLTRSQYWAVYADVMADLGGLGTEGGGIHPAEVEVFDEITELEDPEVRTVRSGTDADDEDPQVRSIAADLDGSRQDLTAMSPVRPCAPRTTRPRSRWSR